MENKVKGKLGEALAKKHLESVGIKIIEENYRYKRGEIDLIGILSNKLLVFIEVKYRKNSNYGNPEDFVSKRQKKNIIHTADAYIHQTHWKKTFVLMSSVFWSRIKPLPILKMLFIEKLMVFKGARGRLYE